MQNYLEIANSKFVFIVCGLAILFVLLQSVLFLIIGWKRGLRLGLERNTMINAIKSSAIFSIVPSLPIVLSLIAIVPILGVAFPWLRLSIIGSAPYELISADIGAKSMGVAGLGDIGYTAQVFANSMWIMSVGIIWGMIYSIFFMKKYQKSLAKVKKEDSSWASILISALYFGMLSVYIGSPVIEGGLPLITLVSGGFVMLFITYIIKKYKADWLNNFSLALSMICAMACAVIANSIL